MANENIQELKFQVGEAWKGVYSPSTAYGLANVVQDPTGLSIYRSLKSGNVGHPLSNASWWFRIIDLSSIKAESDRIAALNQSIAQDEALRVAAEELRQQHEAERVAAETQRNEAEQQRISAEQARVNAESASATAEQQRITAEEGRVSAESARVTAEQARVLAETLRANAEDQRAANEQNRVAAEQQRIERAEQDHQRAESDHAAYIDSLGAFDISAYHATDSVLAKYADLTAALGTNGANIPDDLRKGGMSVKFVQSSDNKYIRYNLIADEFTTDVTKWAIDDVGVYVENPEFVYVRTDKDDKILWAIKTGGDIYYGAGCPQQVKDYIEEKLAELSLDEYEDIVAFLSDYLGSDTTLKTLLDSKLDAEGLDPDALGTVQTVENPEFIEAKTDSEGKILAGRTPDGAAFENVGFSTPKMSIDGHTIENIEDPEGRSEITTDSEGKIISYRDADGVKHENVGIESNSVTTNSLNLTADGMTEFQQALKDAGFQPGGAGDWSDATELKVSMPNCAVLNIISDIDIGSLRKEGMPDAVEGVNYNVPTQVEFYDMSGNYFKKWTLMSGQGRSSMSHPKKNLAFDFFNGEIEDDESFKMKFGNWVAQDSFHLKGYYNDPFRGVGAITYKFYDQVVKSRGIADDYVWKKALIDINDITETSNGASTASETESQFFTGAKCFPDGFPVIVYQNGEFYGIYVWQLKKHRDNMHQNKKKAKHIHLDGIINENTLWNANGDASRVVWTTSSPEGFEVRNPKDMYLMDGHKYDADNNGGELMDETSPYYDPNNEKHVRTAQVKQYILNLSTAMQAIKDAKAVYEASSKTAEDLATYKAVVETYFDIDNVIDYIITGDVVNNYDGFSQNWQWFTYDGVKWYIGLYDCDGCFGNWFELNDTIKAPIPTEVEDPGWNNSYKGHVLGAIRLNFILDYYTSEFDARYAELRNKKIIDVNNILSLFTDWMSRVGDTYTYEKEWKKWPGFIKNDSILRVKKWIETSIAKRDIVYNYSI